MVRLSLIYDVTTDAGLPTILPGELYARRAGLQMFRIGLHESHDLLGRPSGSTAILSAVMLSPATPM